MKLGAQLYTVHDHCKNLADFEKSLEKVAAIGYEYVQVSGTCDFNAKWLRDKLEKYGLKCVITHNSEDKLKNSIDYVIDDHNTFDCKYIGLGGMPFLWDQSVTLEDVVNNFKRDFTPIAQKIKDAGKLFMYHNHDLEFARLENENRIAFDFLIEEMPAELMGFTIDTYWIQKGGANPADFIRRLKGRCPVVHFKDYKVLRACKIDGAPERGDILAACGDGNLDFKEIIKACEYAGTEYIMVEQDNCYGEDPFVCLERSYKYLKSLGL